jgi:hypothetical protein
MFRQQGRGDEREPVVRPLLGTAPAAVTPTAPRRLPAHSRDERRLARIDRKVAERDQQGD